MQAAPVKSPLFAGNAGSIITSPEWQTWYQQLQIATAAAAGHGFVYPEDYGAVGNGIHDDTVAFQAAVNASQDHILWLNGKYFLTNTITAALGGSYWVQGVGGMYNGDGATIIWGGAATKAVFNLGGTPLYISGAYQSGNTTWQNNTRISDVKFKLAAGCTAVVYAHDMDNFLTERVFIDGQGRTDVRGGIDVRGTVSNALLDLTTIYNAPNAYAFRMGDGTVWTKYNKCCAQLVALGYWIGDCLDYEEPWSTGHVKFEQSSCEGTVTGGSPVVKFKTDALSAGASSGATSIGVGTGSNFVTGDSIFIGRGNSNFEMNVVSSVVSNTVYLVYALAYNHVSAEPVKAGTIGIHAGGSSALPVLNLKADQCMFNWVGCGIDAHDLYILDVDTPMVPGKLKRMLYLDGNILHVNMKNPYVNAGIMDSDYAFFEITNPGTRGGVYFFYWEGRLDRSGVTNPYINNQTDPSKPLNGVYVGNDGIEGLVPLPPGFTCLQMDYLGIHLREAMAQGAGLHYSTGLSGSESIWLRCAGVLGGSGSDVLTLYRYDSIANPRMSCGSGGFFLYYNANPAYACFGVTSGEKIYMWALPAYANNAAAVAGGLTGGQLYRTGADPDTVCVVH